MLGLSVHLPNLKCNLANVQFQVKSIVWGLGNDLLKNSATPVKVSYDWMIESIATVCVEVSLLTGTCDR